MDEMLYDPTKGFLKLGRRGARNHERMGGVHSRAFTLGSICTLGHAIVQ